MIQLSNKEHQHFLICALAEAKRFQAKQHSVSVGAVIVKDQIIVARGHYRGSGTPHAEVDAIKQLSTQNRADLRLYVTLEPCNHFGQTPPCTQAILKSGIQHVIFGCRDLNPEVIGGGMEALHAQGINIQHIKVPSIDDFYAPYLYGVHTKLPWIHLKQVACKDTRLMGDRQNRIHITHKAANAWTMTERAKADAILTSTTTICTDDPIFTVRSKKGQHISSPPLIICGTQPISQSMKIHQFKRDIYYIQSDIKQYLKQLYQQGIRRIWMESGPRLAEYMIYQGLIQRLTVIYSPLTLKTAQPVYLSNYTFPVKQRIALEEDELYEYILTTQ